MLVYKLVTSIYFMIVRQKVVAVAQTNPALNGHVKGCHFTRQPLLLLA